MSRKKCQKNENSFGGRLNSFRKSKGINIVTFSKLLGISHSSLSAVENNKTITSAQTINNLLQNTDINIYWLFAGEGEMTRKPEKAGEDKNEAPIYKVEEDDPETVSLLSMTRRVLKSDTDYSASLSANIRSFHYAIKTESRLNGLENKIEQIEKNLKQSNCIQKENHKNDRGEILKKRAM